MTEKRSAPDVNEHARALSAMREVVEHRCGYCGTRFTGIACAKFCSGRCKTAAVRARARAHATQRRPESERELEAAQAS